MAKRPSKAVLLREARESVAAAKKELDDLNRSRADREKRYAVVSKKVAKARQPAVRKRNNGDVELRDTWHLSPDSGWNKPDLDLGSPKTIKAALEQLVAGDVKLADGTYGSAPSTAPRLAKAYRVMNPEDTRKLRRLDGLLARYTKERLALIAAAFDRGIEQTPEGLARMAIANAQLRTESNHTQPEHYDPREGAAKRLELAQAHLAGVRAKGFDCPCSGCDSRRAREAYQREETAKLDAHLATLPKAKVKACPCGHGHIVPIDRIREWVTINERQVWRDNVPVFYCPTTGRRYVHAGILGPELVAEAKAKAKAEAEAIKRAAKREREIMADGGVTFRCPTCEEDRVAMPEDGQDPNDGEPVRYVSCPTCREEWNVDNVRIVKRGKGARLEPQAPATEEREADAA